MGWLSTRSSANSFPFVVRLQIRSFLYRQQKQLPNNAKISRATSTQIVGTNLKLEIPANSGRCRARSVHPVQTFLPIWDGAKSIRMWSLHTPGNKIRPATS